MSALGAAASLPGNILSLISSHAKPKVTTDASTGAGKLKAATTSTGNAAGATTNIGDTFLSLLTKELQNQDPTAPMDSTAMVGQMISLNQLDQLIAINQALTPTTTATTTPTNGATGGVTSDSASALAARQALLASATASPSAGASPFSMDSTLNAAAQSASNAGTLNLSNFNSIFGGK